MSLRVSELTKCQINCREQELHTSKAYHFKCWNRDKHKNPKNSQGKKVCSQRIRNQFTIRIPSRNTGGWRDDHNIETRLFPFLKYTSSQTFKNERRTFSDMKEFQNVFPESYPRMCFTNTRE